MCLAPVQIKNPNRGRKDKLSHLVDTKSQYINIPCGHCSECIANKQMSLVQRVQMEATKNHVFFCTLTYNNDSLPVVLTSNGYAIRYADVSDVQKMHKRLRINNAFGRPFRFIAVSELGSKRGRPHLHILYLLPKYDSDDYATIFNLEKTMFDAVLANWVRNYGSDKKPKYKPLLTYKCRMVHGTMKRNYDLHYVNPALTDKGEADVAFYVLKYMLKPSDRAVRLQQALHLNLDEDEYNSIWNLVKPRYFKSLGFGFNGLDKDKDIVDYIRSCVQRSKSVSEFPSFYNPIDGKSFPLSRYYRNCGDTYTLHDAEAFSFQSTKLPEDIIDERSNEIKLRKMKQAAKRVQLVDNRVGDLFDDDDDIYE